MLYLTVPYCTISLTHSTVNKSITIHSTIAFSHIAMHSHICKFQNCWKWNCICSTLDRRKRNKPHIATRESTRLYNLGELVGTFERMSSVNVYYHYGDISKLYWIGSVCSFILSVKIEFKNNSQSIPYSKDWRFHHTSHWNFCTSLIQILNPIIKKY